MRTAAGSFPIQVGVKLVDADGTRYHPAPDAAADSESWQRTQRTEMLHWKELRRAVLFVQNTSGSRETFFEDSCSLAR